MVGSIGRSGGARNFKPKDLPEGNGKPESPRELSPRAKHFFEWLIDRLGAEQGGSVWSRADGSLLASIAETLESEEILAGLIKQSPDDLRLHRMRGQMGDRIVRASALLGLCPRDRSRLPEAVEDDGGDEADPGLSILRRMGIDPQN